MTLRKLKWFGLILVVSAAGVLTFFSFRQQVPSIFKPRTLLRQAQEVQGSVSLHIDFGDGQSKDFPTIPHVTGATAFSILEEETARVGLALYSSEASSIGVFIRQIGEKKNGDGGRYWQYWVNEKFAMVAADRYALHPGDRVEWRFTTAQEM